MLSKITGNEATYLFTAKILGKYDVKYYRCNETGFIQTEEPHWLDEAYSSAITQLDIGLPYRNYTLATRVSKILSENFNVQKTYLDYAGGYGLFTRLMRDKGFNFYHTDKYCQNLFANYFDLSDLQENTKFELVTTFEVFEHLANPIEEIKQILEFSDNLLFSTELQPNNISKVEDWSYFSTETGQHVSFYNTDTLQYIADKLGYNFYTDGSFLHLLTKKKFGHNLLAPVKEGFLLRKAKKYIRKKENATGIPESLLMHDWQLIKNKLNGKSN